jgi:hypothetical protein
MTPRLLPLLFAAWLCAAARATPPTPPVQKQGDASVWITTPSGDPHSLPIADEATVTVRVESAAPLHVEASQDKKATPLWSLEPKGPPRASEAKGAAVWEQEYVLTPHKEGEHLIELPPLRYRTGEGEWRSVTWKPVKVRVTTEIAKVEPSSARDITAIEDVPAAEPARGWLLWAGLGLGVLLLGVMALVLGSRRAPKPPALPPHEWALRELARLAERCPAGGEEVEALLTALSGVLRRYLEGRFQIPAERQTTAEFLEAVRTNSALSSEQQTALGELLKRCDLAKFARVWPSAEECQALVIEARDFVEKTAPKAAAGQS